jgi:hypothetical protein
MKIGEARDRCRYAKKCDGTRDGDSATQKYLQSESAAIGRHRMSKATRRPGRSRLPFGHPAPKAPGSQERRLGAGLLELLTGSVPETTQGCFLEGPELLLSVAHSCPPEHLWPLQTDAQAAPASFLGTEKTIVSVPGSEARPVAGQWPGQPARGHPRGRWVDGRRSSCCRSRHGDAHAALLPGGI